VLKKSKLCLQYDVTSLKMYLEIVGQPWITVKRKRRIQNSLLSFQEKSSGGNALALTDVHEGRTRHPQIRKIFSV